MVCIFSEHNYLDLTVLMPTFILYLLCKEQKTHPHFFPHVQSPQCQCFTSLFWVSSICFRTQNRTFTTLLTDSSLSSSHLNCSLSDCCPLPAFHWEWVRDDVVLHAVRAMTQKRVCFLLAAENLCHATLPLPLPIFQEGAMERSKWQPF